jgi:hypothetical protein
VAEERNIVAGLQSVFAGCLHIDLSGRQVG